MGSAAEAYHPVWTLHHRRDERRDREGQTARRRSSCGANPVPPSF